MELNRIYNEDCFLTMQRMGKVVDLIITSPPYNMTKRKGGISDTGRYDVYEDWLTETDYLNFVVKAFNGFDDVLKENKVVIFNFGYSIENPSLPNKIVCEIEKNTNFMLTDTIVWKKKNGLPFPAQKRRLSRIWEFVFVFCRKSELNTYDVYKGVSKVSEKTKQTYYNVFYNYIEARNNDGVCPYNQATFSTELCEKLLRLYAEKGNVVYDPFMGSGTTAVACKCGGYSFVGSEISERQCEWANSRLKQYAFNEPLRNIKGDNVNGT